MNFKLSICFLFLVLLVVDAQLMNPRFHAFLQNLSPEERIQMRERARGFFGSLTPQQKSEMRSIFMANRGNPTAMRQAMGQWAQGQNGQVQSAFERFHEMRQKFQG
ncbi:hypothetical protein M3Y95_01043200 [Aphelenchoides besseyi]|nr:hypothetical protein M3Y95_01043200 [Aphelenchoides besseyi]